MSEARSHNPFAAFAGRLPRGWVGPVVVSLALHLLLVVAFRTLVPDRQHHQVVPVPTHINARMVSLEATQGRPPEKPAARPAVKKVVKKVVRKEVKPKPAPRVKPEPVPVPKPEVTRPEPKPTPKPEPKVAQPAPSRPPRPAPVTRPEPAPEPEPDTSAADAAAQAAQLVADREAAASYEGLIAELVAAHWSRPPSSTPGLQVLLGIALLPTGEVVRVETLKSSGNIAFDRSAVRAVEAATPFRELQALPPRVFERYFRRFRFLFIPEDLSE